MRWARTPGPGPWWHERTSGVWTWEPPLWFDVLCFLTGLVLGCWVQ